MAQNPLICLRGFETAQKALTLLRGFETAQKALILLRPVGSEIININRFALPGLYPPLDSYPPVPCCLCGRCRHVRRGKDCHIPSPSWPSRQCAFA